MLKQSYPYYLANRPDAPNTDLEVLDKYTGEVATRVAMADAEAMTPRSSWRSCASCSSISPSALNNSSKESKASCLS